MIKQYKKKSGKEVIEAMQVTADNFAEIWQWEICIEVKYKDKKKTVFESLQVDGDWVDVFVGDFVYIDKKLEAHSLKADAFLKKYEEVIV